MDEIDNNTEQIKQIANDTLKYINSIIVNEQYHIFPGSTTIMCYMKLNNNNVILTECTYVNLDEFNMEEGCKKVRFLAIQKILELKQIEILDELYDLVDNTTVNIK